MKRPVFVTLVSVVMTITGLAQLVIGGLVIAERNNATQLAKANLTTGKATGLGIGLLIGGAFSVLLAVGLLRGSRGARGLVGVVAVAQIAFGIYGLVDLGSDRKPAAIGGIVGGIVSLYFLFGTDKAKQYFAAR
jgi:hypothetical protein